MGEGDASSKVKNFSMWKANEEGNSRSSMKQSKPQDQQILPKACTLTGNGTPPEALEFESCKELKSILHWITSVVILEGLF